MNTEEMMVLTKEGLATLTSEILALVNTRITDRMVETVNENSDANHVPTASAVHEGLKNLKRIMPLVISDLDITKATITPDDKTVYVVRKTAAAKDGVMYIWIQDLGFIKVGSTNTEGGGTDLAVITDDDIRSIVASAGTATAPTF